MEAAVVVVHMVEVAVVRTAVVAEAVATRAEVPEAVDRMPVLRAHPPVDPMRAAGALAQMRVITEAGIGGIRFMAVPLRAGRGTSAGVAGKGAASGSNGVPRACGWK